MPVAPRDSGLAALLRRIRRTTFGTDGVAMRRRGRGATPPPSSSPPPELEVRSARGELPREHYQQRRGGQQGR
jgi:hypothetical protein